MQDIPETTLLVLTSSPAEIKVASALQAAAQALGHTGGCCIVQLADVTDLKLFIYQADPWSVMAIDDASICALRDAFSLSEDEFSVDNPIEISGYTLVAVSNFADCLEDQEVKRVAWERMKRAEHPKNPLD